MTPARDRRPRHQQVAAHLRALIMSGELPAGMQLPSTQHLTAQYGAANTTISRAIRALKDEQWLTSRAGVGVYVRQRRIVPLLVSVYNTPTPDDYTYHLLDVAEVQAPPEVTNALRLSEARAAILRYRLETRRGEPSALSWSYYPFDLAAGSPLAGPTKIRGGAPVALAALGYPQRRFTERVSARPPTTDELERLELPIDVPVLRQFKTIYSDHDRPVEATIVVKGTHLYELLYHETIETQEDIENGEPPSRT